MKELNSFQEMKLIIKRIERFAGFKMILLLVALLSFQTVQAQLITKEIVQVAPAISGTTGNLDVTFRVTVSNNLGYQMYQFSLTDDLADNNNFGSAFIGIATGPQIISGPMGYTASLIFDGYDETDLVIPTMPGLNDAETVVVEFTAEIDPLAAGAPSVLQNTAVFDFTIEASVELPNCWNDCVVACNDMVNVAANSQCETDILAEMILEGEDEECARLGFFSVTLTDEFGVDVPLPVSSSYIGQTLDVTVTNIVCNNSCSGKVLIEDKTPPVLACKDTLIRCNQSIDPINLGFPVPLNQIVDPLNGPTYVASGIDACGVVNLSYADSLQDNGCGSDTSSIIYRKWSATDVSGFTSFCYDTIYLVRGNLVDITLPLHYDGIPGHEAALECDGDWTKFANGFPDTSATGTGAPSGILCGKIQFFFEDDTIKVCASSYKLLRRWIIVDWCNPQDRMEYIQQIKVVDHDAPLATCPSSIIEIDMNKWLCGRDRWAIPLPIFDTTGINADPATIDHPIVHEECGTWTYEIRHIAAADAGADSDDCTPQAGLGNLNHVRQVGIDVATGLPLYELFDIPQGCNWLYYDIIDDCGNVTECVFDIFIKDNLKPIPVCHEHTVVSLSSEKGGLIRVPASVFDDGSHDNCGIDTMLVIRDSLLRGFVEFDCSDVGKEIDVQLHIFDENGNSSHCNVKVTVQDKIPPVITYCPPNVVVDCGTDVTDLSVFGTVLFDDNCDATVEVTPKDGTNALNACGLGTIIRTFTVTDNGGLKTICRQSITVEDKTPFSRNDIHFPEDTVVLNVCSGDISPDVLGKPIYSNLDDCNQIAASFEDKTFSYVEGACFKIIRYWSVLDWCTYDPTTGAGKWDTVQIIKILNDIAPIITSSCDDATIDIEVNECAVDFTLEATGTDDCTPTDKLKWTYDFEDKNGVHYTGNRARVSLRDIEIGTHHITWTVEDQCGNTTSCDYDVIVLDKKKPTPYCRNGLTTVLMPTTGEITIWAKDFDIGSFDNCSTKNKLKISFSENVRDILRTYSCADLSNGVSDTFEVEIWVTDAAGNNDYCSTSVIIQDNQDVCPDLNVVTSGTISGLVGTNDNRMMESIEVQLEDIATQGMNMHMTNNQGKFAFTPLKMNKSYKLTVKYDVDYSNGVSTRDLVAIQKHLLGIKEIDSPYKLIAADANNSANISTRDISQLRKLILGKINSLPDCDSWRFIDSEYTFKDVKNPFNFEESIMIQDLNKDEEFNHFIAIKMGDVTGDAKVNGVEGVNTRSHETMMWNISAVSYGSNEIVEVPVYGSDDITIEGFQMTLELPSDMELQNVKSGLIDINESNLGLMDLHNDRMALSWDNVNGVKCNSLEPLFTIVFLSQAKGNLDELKTSSAIAQSEVYLQGGDIMDLIIRDNNQNTTDKFELYQNTPNPFDQLTTIGFNLPNASKVTLSIFDMSGKTLKSFRLYKEKGYGTIDVDLSDLSVSGVLYYKLESDVHSATRKMVIIK